MAARVELRINDQIFPTKEAATRYVRDLMAKYTAAEPLNAADARFVLDLLQWHRLASKKIGCGISQFLIRPAPPFFRNRAFYIIRTDGSPVEFSFVECISPTSQLSRFQNACRTAVHIQIEDFVR